MQIREFERVHGTKKIVKQYLLFSFLFELVSLTIYFSLFFTIAKKREEAKMLTDA